MSLHLSCHYKMPPRHVSMPGGLSTPTCLSIHACYPTLRQLRMAKEGVSHGGLGLLAKHRKRERLKVLLDVLKTFRTLVSLRGEEEEEEEEVFTTLLFTRFLSNVLGLVLGSYCR